MAETVLGAVLQVVFDRLASREVLNLFQGSELDQSLVNKLKTLVLAVEKLLLDAEEKQMNNRAVKLWLDELKHWFYRAEEVVDEISTEALRSSLESPPEPQSFRTKVRNLIPAFSSSSSFENTVNLKMKEIISMLENMLSQKDALGLRELSFAKSPERVGLLPTTGVLEDYKVCGRNEEKEKIIQFLVSKETERSSMDIIAIVGMGGLGKTTLAKLVYNDARLNETFDLKVWVCVSDQFDVLRVTKSMYESITGEPCTGSPDLNFLQTKLSVKLRNKRFLLVLDDVWNEDYRNWECLRAPLLVGAYGSQIVITTRNDEVASIMRTTPVFRLKPLSEEDSWSLFSRHAFECGNSIANSSLEQIGKKIVQKCKGLPLAIKTLGSLLRSKQSNSEWEAILQSTLWKLPCEKNSVVPALRLSYYYLPSHLKRCFSYCAMFPKDYRIHRQKLVFLWMAENLLPCNERRIEDVGDECISQLVSRSFLEPMTQSYVAMHDLMHDLAQEASGDILVRYEAESMSTVADRVRHFSYVLDCFDGMKKFQVIHKAKYLRTFLQLHDTKYHFKQKYFLSNQTINLVLQSRCLRVLSLSKYENLMIPESIGILRHLCYLDISSTTIKQLPESVSTLYNLQTLLLSDCACLQRLPANMWRLVSLRHLDIRGTTSLLYMPKQMNKLKRLQTLTDFVVGKSVGASIQELEELPQIDGRLALRRLQNVTTTDDAFYANLSQREHLHELALEFDMVENDDSEKGRVVLENLKPHTNLRRLTIRNYVGTRFPSWLDPGCAVYTNMTYLCLTGCLYCHSLPPLGELPFLRDLEIDGMDYLMKVGPEFYGHKSSSSDPFPLLQFLSFNHMNSWEVWLKRDFRGGAVCFPCLQVLSLVDCPKLKGNLPVHVPSLKRLHINGCEQLVGLLPQVPYMAPTEVAACLPAELTGVFDPTSITSLALERLVQIEKLPSQLDWLPSLINLRISQCKNLNSLANVKLPHKLETLSVEGCEVLESLSVGLAFQTNLRSITLCQCPILRCVPGESLPTSLHHLLVKSCESWEFPIPMESMHQYTSLERLSFWNMGSHFVSFPLGVFPNLKIIGFWSCKHLLKVYIPEGIGGNGLTSLSRLFVRKCPRVKMVGKATGRGEATILPVPSLTLFSMFACKNLKGVIELEEVLLSKLVTLSVDNLDKLISQQNPTRRWLRFSCLAKLCLSYQDAEGFPDEASMALPSSLREVNIWAFPRLKYLDGKRLQSLKYLEKLKIGKCPQLQCLPAEGFPPSLGCLDIRACPLLEERCQRDKGQDWSKIHHVPCVMINGRCINSA